MREQGEQQVPVGRISGPFFVVRSACEQSREDCPYFVLSRGPCDVVFPTGKVPRRWDRQWYAQETADYCNAQVKRIALLLQQRQQAEGYLRKERLDAQIELILEELQVICFLTETEQEESPSYNAIKIA